MANRFTDSDPGAEHYSKLSIGPMDVAESWDLPPHLYCAVKYVARYRDKGDPEGDLIKAINYIRRYLQWMKDREQV